MVPQHLSSPAGSQGAREAVVPSSVDARLKRSSTTSLVVPKMESCLDVVCRDEDAQVAPHGAMPLTSKSAAAAMPFTADADQLWRQQLWTSDSLDSVVTNGLPAASTMQSGLWRCFNPALVETAQQEMGGADNLSLAFLDQELGSFQGGLAPDALLDQIASAPGRMLFGGENNTDRAPPPPESSALPQGGAPWQPSSATVSELWDLLRSTAAM